VGDSTLDEKNLNSFQEQISLINWYLLRNTKSTKFKDLSQIEVAFKIWHHFLLEVGLIEKFSRAKILRIYVAT